jgi:type I restriction enzyme M protein
MNTTALEADTRVLIDKSLENLGWVFSGKKQNVFLEQPKTQKEKKLLSGKRLDYVLYAKDEHNDEHAIIVIEAKRKGERIDTALEQGIHYAKTLDAPIVFATDGLFCKSYHTKFDRTPILNGEEVDEFLRETLAIKYLASWEVNTVSPKVQYDRKELIKIFDEANNMLRGDGLRAGIERFGEFANILFLKLISENEQIKRESGKESGFDFACHWDKIKNTPESTRIEYISKTVYPRLNNLYGTEIFTPLTIRSAAILKEIMDKLDPLTLTDVDSDVKGDAFEYFLKESAATKNDLGEYFTPRHIVKTMVKIANPQIGEKVYDPFCGTGGFLIESFRHIWNTMAHTEENEKRLREQTIYGNEITNTARITKMNMILAGDGHSNIHMKDSLADPIDGTEEYKEKQPNGKTETKHRGYDVVITNMPYSQKTKHGDLYALPSNNGDSICVQHCMKAINSTSENGRMALVVPEGFLFRKDLSKTRELLLKNCNLQSVISLPQGVFLPYTGVKTNIIYATKVNQKLTSAQKRKDFWYFEVKSDGYTLDNHRRKLDKGSDLDKYQEYRKLDKDQRQEMLDVGFEAIPLNKVKENAYVLVGSRYRATQSEVYKYESKKLSEVSEFIRGISFPKSAQKIGLHSGYLGIVTTKAAQATGIVDNDVVFVEMSYAKKEKFLQEGDILISLANSLSLIGRTTYVDKQHEGLSFGAFMGLIRPNRKKVLPRMLYYLLNSDVAKQYFITSAKTTTNISNLTFEDLNEFVLSLPPIEVQQQIVDELDGYQRIIDGARTVVGNYKPYIPKNINGENKPIDAIATVRPSKEEVKRLPENTLVSFVPMSDINTHHILFVAKEERALKDVFTGFTYFKDGDVLLAKITPCFENGKAGIARNLKNGIGFGSTEYIVIRANTDIVYPEWIYYHINSTDFIEKGKKSMTGTAGQQRVDINFVKDYSIIVPSLKTQLQILDSIASEQELVNSSQRLIDVFTQKMQDRINEIWGE